MVICYVSKKIAVWKKRSHAGRHVGNLANAGICLQENYKNARITLALPRLMSCAGSQWKWKCQLEIVMLHGGGKASVTSSRIYSFTREPSRDAALICAFVESLHLCDILGAH